MEVYVVWEYYWGPEGIGKYLYVIHSDLKKAEAIVGNSSKNRGFLSTWYELEKRTIEV